MQYILTAHNEENDAVEEVNVFEIELEEFDSNTYFTEPDRNKKHGLETIKAFVEEIERTGMSQGLFNDLMDIAEINEIAEEGLRTWTNAEEFVQEEFLDLLNIEISNATMKYIFEKNIDYESLAEDIVDTADGGSRYVTDGSMFIERIY